MKRKLLLTVVLVSLGAVLFVPTAAFPFELSDDGVDPVEEIADIEMSPTTGPNSAYAEFDEQGQLRLNLTTENQERAGVAINENSITKIDEIFNIRNDGENNATVWVSNDAADVEFHHGTNSEHSIEGERNNVTLEPDETIKVGLLIDTTDSDHDVAQSDQFSVYGLIEEADEDGPDDTPDDPPEEDTPDDTPEDDTSDDPPEEDTPDDTPDDPPEDDTPDDPPEEDTPDDPPEDDTSDDPPEEDTPEDTPDDPPEDEDIPADDTDEAVAGEDPQDATDESSEEVQGEDDDSVGTTAEGGTFFEDGGLGNTLAGTLSSSLLLLLLALLLGAATFYGVRKLSAEDA